MVLVCRRLGLVRVVLVRLRGWIKDNHKSAQDIVSA